MAGGRSGAEEPAGPRAESLVRNQTGRRSGKKQAKGTQGKSLAKSPGIAMPWCRLRLREQPVP